MPGRIDGIVAIRQLRSNPDTEDIPIIVVSAWGSAKHKERAMTAGADAHFTKPVAMDELNGAVNCRMRLILFKRRSAHYQRGLGRWNDGFTDTAGP
jgi:CheY-like chemotaxis protein